MTNKFKFRFLCALKQFYYINIQLKSRGKIIILFIFPSIDDSTMIQVDNVFYLIFKTKNNLLSYFAMTSLL